MKNNLRIAAIQFDIKWESKHENLRIIEKNLDKISLNELRKFNKSLDKSVLKIFNVKNSMNSKSSYGGTAEKNIKKMIKKYKKEAR